MTVRVLRVLEYEYPDIEEMAADMERWMVPAVGTKRPNSRTLIRSALMVPSVVEASEPDKASDEEAREAFLSGQTCRVPR